MLTDQSRSLKKIVAALDSLTLFRSLSETPVLLALREFLILFAVEDRNAHAAYSRLIGVLLEQQPVSGRHELDLYKEHLLNLIAADENLFSLASEKYQFEELDKLLLKDAAKDMELLKLVYECNLVAIGQQLAADREMGEFVPQIETLVREETVGEGYPAYYFTNRENLKKVFSERADWKSNLRELHMYYRQTGSGNFGRYWAFKWNALADGRKGLVGVSNPDPIHLDDLVGCEDQKAEIVRNTKQFIHGYSANNMLLYGDRGTGKSSTIKGLVHLFGAEGLRIIEVSKHDLLAIHHIVEAVEGRAQKFIIFIDDLSFEEDETEYKELKALLEGSIARPPVNVLVYATSNRRNLVREYFSDREADEVGRQDTYQEKLSLADRFGIKLVYAAPDKQDYLKTVEAIAAKEGIKIERSELHELALRWALWHNAPSGRTARQFINDLKGKLDLNG